MDIPLNSGCLVPIDLRFPEGSVLNPSDVAAVVGGNVCVRALQVMHRRKRHRAAHRPRSA